MTGKTQNCFTKHGLSKLDIDKILTNGEKYNTADPNEGYARAAEDLIPQYQSLIEAIQSAMVSRLKEQNAAPTTFDPAKGAQEVTGADGVTRKFSADGFEVGGAGKNWLAYASADQKKAGVKDVIDAHYANESVARKYGSSGSAEIEGEYSGPVTYVDDPVKFAADHPGFTVAANRLNKMGLGHLFHLVDQIVIAEDSEQFDASGALYWDPKTQKLQLFLDRAILDNEGRLAFTVQHEFGHMADGAFGKAGGGKYSSTLPRHVANAAMIESLKDTTLGAVLEYPMSQQSDVAMREELVAQLFGLAANPDNLAKLPPVLAHYITGVIKDAKATSKTTVKDAIERAKRETSSQSRKSDAGVTNAQGQLQQNVREAGQDQANGQRHSALSQQVEEAARRVSGRSGAIIAGNTTHVVKKMALSLMSLHDIVEKFQHTVPSIGKWYEAVQNAQATRRQLEQDAEKIAAAAEKLQGGTGRVNDFISRSTFEQKWGYTPSWKSDVAIDPALKGMYDRLTGSEQEIVRAVFAHGEKMRVKRKEMLSKLGVDSLLKMSSELQGPYAPLKRFGDFVAVLKSAELRAAEAAEDSKLVEKLKGSAEHYVVSYFDTPGQAKQFAYENKLGNGGRYAFSDSFEKSSRPNEGRTVPAKVLQEVMAALKLNDDVDPKQKAAVEQMIKDMAFQYMDDQHARTSGLKRLNRAGYDQDMVRSFLSHARAEASFLSNMQHGQDINSAFLEMGKQAKNPATGTRDHQDAVKTVAEHYADMLHYRETPVQDRIMAFTSAWQLATSLGYHVTNFMQGAMVTVPKLAADFGNYSGAWKHLYNGYKLMNAAGWGNNFDLAKVQDPGLRNALQRAMDMGVLDVGMNEDLAHFEATRTGIAGVDNTSKAARSALHKLRQMSRAVEIMNRVSAATAAYNMMLEKTGSQSEASAYATKILQSTQGDFSRVGSPLLLKKLPKFMTQYKKYQFMMAALYAKAYTQAFHGATAEERAIGRRMLAFKLGHTAFAAGALGLPLMNVVSLVFSALGGDDEPYDLERSLRHTIGDENVADLLLHGPLAYLGLDMSAKLGEDKVFSIMPYGSWDFTSASGVAKTAMGLAGPAASQVGRFADGIGLFQRGQYEKGVEKFVPKGLESAMKAFRIANEGYTLKNGDLMVKPEDINGLALTLDALGMPSTGLKKMDWLRSQQYEIGQFFQQRTKEIEHDYVMAHRSGDGEAMAKAREEWQGLQQGKDNLRYLFNDSHDALKKQPLSTLLKAPMNSNKREQKLQKSAAIAD